MGLGEAKDEVEEMLLFGRSISRFNPLREGRLAKPLLVKGADSLVKLAPAPTSEPDGARTHHDKEDEPGELGSAGFSPANSLISPQ